MSSEDHARALADLAVQLQGAHGEQPTAEAIIKQALDLVPDADWVSLTVRGRRGSYVTLASTASEAEEADELQYALGEGPCVEAVGGADWYRSGSIRDDPRWPSWGPKAAELGIGSLLSVQLATEPPSALGALNMYAAEEGRFSDRDEVDFAVLAGVHAAIALASARESHGLHSAIASRHSIGLAQGMLMERYHLDVARSFELLRRYSSDMNIKLAEVAAHIVATRQLPVQQSAPETDRSPDQSAQGAADRLE